MMDLNRQRSIPQVPKKILEGQNRVVEGPDQNSVGSSVRARGARQNSEFSQVNSGGARPVAGRPPRLPVSPATDEVDVNESGALVQRPIVPAVQNDKTTAPTSVAGVSGSISTPLPTSCPVPRFMEILRELPSHISPTPMPPPLPTMATEQITITMEVEEDDITPALSDTM